ncbi:MAG: glycosyltransferase family 2 protein [Rhodospirillaceae bacterium]|jgi:glycosyltransferase involved in cell wall biosynthesis|nr:glycosyltransferase family 2 protein [Rhodospirillaceae bacterium]
MTRTTVLVPSHNEALTIRAVIADVRARIDRVIVIDDGSTDGSADLLADMDVTVVRHDTNAGKGHRLVEGLELAFSEGADQVLTLDGDGQHDPASIDDFLQAAALYPDAMIIGDRFSQKARMPAHRLLANAFGSFFISWACVRQIRDAQCGMRLYPAKFWKDVRVPDNQIERFKFETAALLYAAKAGIWISTVPIDARYEGYVHRPSHFAPVADFFQLFGLVTKFLFAQRLQPRGILVALRLTNPNRSSIAKGKDS